MPVVIRTATLNDVAVILAIERQSDSASHWAIEQYSKLVTEGIVLVAKGHTDPQDSNLFGFICGKAAAGEWEIENVAVVAHFQRCGVADRLLAELILRAKTSDVAAILLEVRESNQPARQLYEKHGFREVGRRTRYYRDPEEDAILYVLN